MTTPWDIYAIGDPDYLFFVLNGIAMLAGGDGDTTASTLGQVAKIGALIGLITVGVKAIMSAGQKFELHLVLLGLILFMALFVPKVTVQITPIGISGAVQPTVCRNGCVIDNVPIGPAAIGAIISQLGVALTERTEQAFASVNGGFKPLPILAGGFGRTMEALAALRELENPTMPLHGDAGAYRETLKYYVSDCWLTRVNQKSESPDRIYTANNVLGSGADGGIEFIDMWSTTQTFIASGSATTGITLPKGELVTCKEAIARLQAHKASIPAWLNVQIGSRTGFAAVAASEENPFEGNGFLSRLGNNLLSNTNGTETLSDTLTGIFHETIGPNQFVAQDYMAAAMTKSVLTDAMRSGASSDLRSQLSTMVSQGAHQRLVDAAGQESMFLRMLKPMTSFFESMVYVLAPFMCFMIFFGQSGLGMLTEYLLMTLWVSLWPFTLTVINLWSNVQIEKSLLAMAAAMEKHGGSPAINSISFVTQVHHEAIDWLTTGAMLTSATPFITLGLLMGGAVTMTSLAGKLSQQDFTNEKIAAPDAIQPAAAHQMSSSISTDPTNGTRVTGSPANQTRISTGEASSNAVASATQSMLQSQNTLSDTLSRVIAQTTGAGQAFSTGFTTAVQNNTSSDNKLISGWSEKQSTGDSLRTSLNMSNEEITSYLMSGGLAKAAFAKIASGRFGLQDSDNNKKALQDARAMEESWGKEVSKGGQFAHSVAKVQSDATSAAVQDVANQGLSLAESDTLTKMAQETRSSAESWTQTNAATSSLGSERSFTTGQFAEMLAKMDQGTQDAVRSDAMMAIRMSGLEGVYREQGDYLRRVEGLRGQAADDAAMVLTLGGVGNVYANHDLVEGRTRDSEAIASQAQGFAELVGKVAGVGQGRASEFVSSNSANQHSDLADTPLREVRDGANDLTRGPTPQQVLDAYNVKKDGTLAETSPRAAPTPPESRVGAITDFDAIYSAGKGMLRGNASENRAEILSDAAGLGLTQIAPTADVLRSALANLDWAYGTNVAPDEGMKLIEAAGQHRFPGDDPTSHDARDLYMAAMSLQRKLGTASGAEEAYAELREAGIRAESSGRLLPEEIDAIYEMAPLDANKVLSSGTTEEDQAPWLYASGNGNIVFDSLQRRLDFQDR